MLRRCCAPFGLWWVLPLDLLFPLPLCLCWWTSTARMGGRNEARRDTETRVERRKETRNKNKREVTGRIPGSRRMKMRLRCNNRLQKLPETAQWVLAAMELQTHASFWALQVAPSCTSPSGIAHQVRRQEGQLRLYRHGCQRGEGLERLRSNSTLSLRKVPLRLCCGSASSYRVGEKMDAHTRERIENVYI
ncbi:hypothetical protein V8C26DRAFT_370317 [Trichoderma gracile]